jgi:hypothetical protein
MTKHQIATKMVRYASEILGLSEIELHFKPKSSFTMKK